MKNNSNSNNNPVEFGMCEKCGKKGRNINKTVLKSERDMVLCYDCYHETTAPEHRGQNEHTSEEIKATQDYLKSKFYGYELKYCPYQRINDKKLGINKEYWDKIDNGD